MDNNDRLLNIIAIALAIWGIYTLYNCPLLEPYGDYHADWNSRVLGPVHYEAEKRLLARPLDQIALETKAKHPHSSLLNTNTTPDAEKQAYQGYEVLTYQADPSFDWLKQSYSGN